MRVKRDKDRRLLRFARALRQSSTDAERKLWSILRSSSLAGFKFRRQYAIGGYILDFYCVKRRLAVELDGGQHNHRAGRTYDSRRTKRLGDCGVRVIRFWDHDVLKHPAVVTETLLRELAEERPSP